jgi:hypothetical protein
MAIPGPTAGDRIGEGQDEKEALLPTGSLVIGLA